MTRKVREPGITRKHAVDHIVPHTLVLLFALAACAKPQEPAPPSNVIDTPTLRAVIASDKGLLMFDTMGGSSASITASRLEVPGLRRDRNDVTVLPADKDQVIVFYCESEGCYRSCRAPAPPSRPVTSRSMSSTGDARLEAGRVCHGVDERIPRGSIPSVRATALKQMIAERNDLLLVDLRSEQSYKEGHIEGAVNSPLYRLSRNYSEIPLDRTLVLIDDRGFRTFLAGSYLEMKGYRVMRLFGGMEAWQEMQAKKQ